MKHRHVYVEYNVCSVCIPFIASNTHIPAVVVAAPKMRQPSTHTVLFRASSLQLTSILSVTCFVAVIWSELWLQWKSKNCGRHCSGGYTYMQRVTDLSELLEEQTFSLASV